MNLNICVEDHLELQCAPSAALVVMHGSQVTRLRFLEPARGNVTEPFTLCNDLLRAANRRHRPQRPTPPASR